MSLSMFFSIYLLCGVCISYTMFSTRETVAEFQAKLCTPEHEGDRETILNLMMIIAAMVMLFYPLMPFVASWHMKRHKDKK